MRDVTLLAASEAGAEAQERHHEISDCHRTCHRKHRLGRRGSRSAGLLLGWRQRRGCLYQRRRGYWAHCELLAEDGLEIPMPKPLAEHQADPEFAGNWVWGMVDVDVTRFEGKAEKINITLPRRLLAKIDDYARAHGETRSGFLAEAARAAMR